MERIILAAERLVDHPRLGRVVSEATDENIRELIFQRYRIIYHIENDTIELLSVIHGARDIGEFKPAPWDVG